MIDREKFESKHYLQNRDPHYINMTKPVSTICIYCLKMMIFTLFAFFKGSTLIVIIILQYLRSRGNYEYTRITEESTHRYGIAHTK